MVSFYVVQKRMIINSKCEGSLIRQSIWSIQLLAKYSKYFDQTQHCTGLHFAPPVLGSQSATSMINMLCSNLKFKSSSLEDCEIKQADCKLFSFYPLYCLVFVNLRIWAAYLLKKIARRTTGAKDFYLVKGIDAPWNSELLYSSIV